MRILTEKEMAEVFGGADENNVTTLGTVTATYPRFKQTGGSYWIGGSSSGYFDEYTGSQTSCYWANPNQVMMSSSVPSAEKVRCYVNESAVAGHGLQSGYDIAVVNEYGYGTLGSTTAGKYDITMSSQSAVPGGSQGFSGFTYSEQDPTTGVVSGSTSLYGSGMLGSGTQSLVTPAYYDALTGQYNQQGYNFGQVTNTEQMILTMAHEAYHQWYRVNYGVAAASQSDAYAEGYGVEALKRYRQNKAAIDTKCKKK